MDLIYKKYLDSNISNAIGIKATLLAYEITILIIVRTSHDLIFSIDTGEEHALVP